MNPKVVLIEERPEDADLTGWTGPGWYWVTPWDLLMTGPFGSEAEALADLEAYEEYMNDLDDSDYPEDGWGDDEGYDPDDPR